MTRSSPASLAAVLFAAAWLGSASPAQAERARWRLGDTKQRYDHEAEQTPDPLPSPGLRLPKFLLVEQTHLDEGRRPLITVADPGDLVWYYALHLPAAELPKKKRPTVVEVADIFPLKTGELKVSGNHSVRRKSKRVTVRSSLVVTASDEKHWLKKGTLLLVKTFDLKRGRLLEAQYTYETKIKPKEGDVREDTWSGVIRPARGQRAAVKVTAKGFHQEVEAAIQRGAGWLKGAADDQLVKYKAHSKYQTYTLGREALACFALLRSGMKPKKLKHHFEWMELQPLAGTYSVSLWIMALEARSIERAPLPPRERSRSVARFRRRQPPKNDLERMQRAVDWLVASRKKGAGWWSYGGRVIPRTGQGEPEPGEDGPIGHGLKEAAKNGDRSNSQFAVLGLHTALAAGLKVPTKVWREVLKESLDAQTDNGPEVSLAGGVFAPNAPLRPDDPRDRPVGATTTRERPQEVPGSTVERGAGLARGWTYAQARRAGASEAYGSMTAAGVSTVAIVREGLRHADKLGPKRDARSLESLRDGLCWLLKHYDPTRNPRNDRHYYYWAYSLEKAMDTAGIERLGPKEWWRDLAAELLSRQEEDGSWGGKLENTALALLVLNRATLPAKLEIGEAVRRATGGDDPSAWDLVIVEGVGQLSLRQLLRAMADDAREAAERLDLLQKSLEILDEGQRPRLLPELRELWDSPHKPTRKWVRQTCKRLAGTNDPAGLDRFSQRWEVLFRASAAHRPEGIPAVRELLKAQDATLPLKRQALLVLGRLRAIEAVGDVIAQLQDDDRDYRQFAWSQLIGMVGGEHCPFDPQAGQSTRLEQVVAWDSWWSAEGPARVEEARIRRAVADLSIPARIPAAEATLRKIGKPALRGLVDGLRSDTTRKVAHALLQEISGETLPPDVQAWLEYVRKQEG